MQYTILYGDNPSKLAVKFTGKASRWPELCAANPQLPKHPTYGCVFTVGKPVTLPASWEPAITFTTQPVPASTTPAVAASPQPGGTAAPTPAAASLINMEQDLIVGGDPMSKSPTALAPAALPATPAAAKVTTTQASIFGGLSSNMILIGGGVMAAIVLAVVVVKSRKGKSPA
jgi:hypothetical protein